MNQVVFFRRLEIYKHMIMINHHVIYECRGNLKSAETDRFPLQHQNYPTHDGMTDSDFKNITSLTTLNVVKGCNNLKMSDFYLNKN